MSNPSDIDVNDKSHAEIDQMNIDELRYESHRLTYYLDRCQWESEQVNKFDLLGKLFDIHIDWINDNSDNADSKYIQKVLSVMFAARKEYENIYGD